MSVRNLFVCAALVVTVGCSPNGNTEQSAAPAPATDNSPSVEVAKAAPPKKGRAADAIHRRQCI